MIDLHTHILPFIDDGAEDMEMSLAMLEIAANDGITDIVVTPHFIPGSFDNTMEVVLEQCERLTSAMKEKNLELRVYPGNEVFISPETPQLLSEGKICSLNRSRYVLIELPMSLVPEYTASVLYEVRLQGYTPIIAHPERNVMIGKNPGILAELVQQGCLAQVNATSITGLYGKDIQKVVMSLLDKGLVHFVSSDSHTCSGRSPKLSKARDIVRNRWGKETARLLFETNGACVINNSEILSCPLEMKGEGRRSWGSIFKKVLFQNLKL